MHFVRLAAAMCGYLAKATGLLGCISWISDQRVVDAINKLPGDVSLVLHAANPAALGDTERRLAAALASPNANQERVLFLGDGRSRLHHKFLVLLDADDDPYAVWTSSSNFAENSSRCLENAVFIEDATIARAYAAEFTQLLIAARKCRDSRKF